jgi:hypothetical protein
MTAENNIIRLKVLRRNNTPADFDDSGGKWCYQPQLCQMQAQIVERQAAELQAYQALAEGLTAQVKALRAENGRLKCGFPK